MAGRTWAAGGAGKGRGGKRGDECCFGASCFLQVESRGPGPSRKDIDAGEGRGQESFFFSFFFLVEAWGGRFDAEVIVDHPKPDVII